MAQDRGGREARASRVKRLKRILVACFLTLLILPTILCIILFVQVRSLERRISAVTEELGFLTEIHRLNGDYELPAGAKPQEEKAEPDEQPDVQPEEIAEVQAPEPEDAKRKVYLTFDDGPSTYTDDILDILDRYDVKATFFVVGRTDEGSLAAYRRIVEEGHTLGMHSYSHKYNEVYASREAFSEDFEKLRSLLEETTGITPKFYRFPGGSSNTVSSVNMGIFAEYLSEQGVTYFDWNISSGDASGGTLPATTIRQNALNGIESKDEAVILFHDAGDKYSTVRALPEVIEAIQAMDDTELLPITEDTVPVQHVTFEE